MNIETKLIKYLSKALDTEDVYLEVPETGIKKFIVIDRTGSSTADMIYTAQIAIQSYDSTRLKASELNEEVKAAMDDFMYEDGVSDCRLMTDYNFTNTARKQHRYQAVYSITHY